MQHASAEGETGITPIMCGETKHHATVSVQHASTYGETGISGLIMLVTSDEQRARTSLPPQHAPPSRRHTRSAADLPRLSTRPDPAPAPPYGETSSAPTLGTLMPSLAGTELTKF